MTNCTRFVPAWVTLLAAALTVSNGSFCHAFPVGNSRIKLVSSSVRLQSPKLFLQKGWFGEGEDEEALVTREDLNRDMLGMEPKVKRKRKNGKGEGYKSLDNRDHLPFSVRTKTPDDPYKTEYLKQKEQQIMKKKNVTNCKATDLDRHMLGLTKGKPIASKKKNSNNKSENGVGDDSTTPSKLIQRRSTKKGKENDENSITTVLGEFELDKSTTSGDVIVLGEKEYRVESARCQYKYAGGKRFVMVRKILEVKEVTRVEKEEVLMRQYESSPSSLLPTVVSDDFE